MAGFDDILKSVQWHKSLKSSLSPGSQLSEMLNSNKLISNSVSGLSMLTEITKSIQQHNRMFAGSKLSDIELMSLQSKFAIPQTTLNAITSINRQHEQLFGGLSSISAALKIQSPALAQINNLKFALGGISGQLAAMAAHKKNWAIIDDFEEVSEQAIEFSESIQGDITEEQQRQFQILLSLIFAFINKHKQKGINAFRFLEVVLVFYGCYTIFSTKPELAEKAEVSQINIKQDTLLHYINLVNEQLRLAKEYLVTKRVCEVKLKPKTKTLTLSKLPKGFEIIVIQVQHKWVFVSYVDPFDNLPQTGWIMKKYLAKP